MKRDATEKRGNRPWWQKVGWQTGDFINALQELGSRLFDILLEAVKGFIEFVKKIDFKLIDFAHPVVAGLIKALGKSCFVLAGGNKSRTPTPESNLRSASPRISTRFAKRHRPP